MIPIKLTIKGLFSYQQEQTIYFDRLIEGQLFGIFGSVGSGKSSILEAIAFALYGETERLNNRDDRNYNMMNLKSDELFIDFVFSNFDEKKYRFLVRGRRHGKKFEKVNTFDRTAYVDDNGSWQPIAESTAEHILGLSYDNFRRTIIIPQGKFQEFLQLTDKARTDMLKDIFQLDKYEFFQQTSSLERKNNERLQLLKGQLAFFDNVTKEHVEAGGQQLSILKNMLNARKVELLQREAKMQELTVLKKLFEELKESEVLHDVLIGKSAEYELLKNKISDYEYCERNFKPDLLRLEELELGIKKREESLLDYQQKLKVSETKLMELQQEHATITLKYSTLDELKQRANDYQIGISILQLKEEITKLNERIGKGKNFVEEAQKAKIQSEKKAVQLKEKLHQKRVEKPDIAQLSEIKSWFREKENRMKMVMQYSASLNSLMEEIKGVGDRIKQLLSSDSEKEDFKASLALKSKNMESRLEELNHAMNHVQIQMKLGDFVAALHRGEACPLCGSTDHPHILAIEDVKNHLDDLKEEEGKLRIELKRIQEIERAYELLNAQKSELIKRKSEINVQYEAEDKLLKKHLDSFNWNKYDKENAEEIEKLLNHYKLTEDEIASIENEINSNEIALRKAETERDNFENAIKKIVAEEQSKSGALEALIRQLKLISIDEIYSSNIEEFKVIIGELLVESDQILSRYDVLQKQLQEHQQLKTVLETRLNAVVDNLEAERERLLFVRAKLSEAIVASKFKDLNEVTSLLSLNISLGEVRKELEYFFQQLFNARTQLDKMREQTAGKHFNQDTIIKEEQLYNDFKEKVQQEQDEYIKLKAEHDRQITYLVEKEKLQQELNKIEERAANLGTMKNLFKGSGFVSYISSVYLQQLCDAANKRFYKLTQQQLKLEVTDKNEFQVRDYLNDGKARLAKTLSGGQTFQASLSLALALAESIQQQNKAKQNFFFLDEGFGSLDKESLIVAFDTLKSLRKENRIVGIISHVEELQQEIDVYLKVRNDSLLGTQVKGNWEN
jgi:DNA repair protein SbcC/Rad50